MEERKSFHQWLWEAGQPHGTEVKQIIALHHAPKPVQHGLKNSILDLNP